MTILRSCRPTQSSRRSYYFGAAILIIVATVTSSGSRNAHLVEGKKAPLSNNRVSASSAGSRGSSRSSGDLNKPRKKGPLSSRRSVIYIEEEEEDEQSDVGNNSEKEDEYLEDDGQDYPDEEDEEEEDVRPILRRDTNTARLAKGSSRPSGSASTSRRHEKLKFDEEDDDEEDDDYYNPSATRRMSSVGATRAARQKGRTTRATTPKYRGAPPPRSRARRNGAGSSGAMVPYAVTNAAGAFTRGLVALKEYIPDPTVVKDSALKAVSAATQTTSSLSKGFYREIKGLTSSELEQVMLKATRPDDSPVKGKHVERLVGVTYQISARYDIYDAVLRKLWKKMVEADWRTKIKSLYVLHRFSADGAADHGPALKARLRELRRTRDPKRKEKYFNSKQLLSGDMSQVNEMYRSFVPRYAHYVLLRAQCFAGMFTEIAPEEKPASKRPSQKANPKQQNPSTSEQVIKPITSTCLRAEHLEAAKLLLKAGCACTPKDGEECENIALAAERVAVDLMSLTSAVAVALNRSIKGKEAKDADPEIVKLWCQFYCEELLPQTKAMVKRTSPKLDAFGLFLPTRMSASVSQEVLKIGLHGGVTDTNEDETDAAINAENEANTVKALESEKESKSTTQGSEGEEGGEKQADEQLEEVVKKAEAEEDEEYEYEEEYYDE